MRITQGQISELITVTKGHINMLESELNAYRARLSLLNNLKEGEEVLTLAIDPEGKLFPVEVYGRYLKVETPVVPFLRHHVGWPAYKEGLG